MARSYTSEKFPVRIECRTNGLCLGWGGGACFFLCPLRHVSLPAHCEGSLFCDVSDPMQCCPLCEVVGKLMPGCLEIFAEKEGTEPIT